MDQTQTETKTYEDFHESLQKLLKVSSSVLKDLGDYGYDVGSNKNILKAQKALNYYMSCYHNTKPKERYLHVNIFEKLFDLHRKSIVADTSITDKWLRASHQEPNTSSKTMVKIVFKQTKSYDVTLYIGFIYVISLQIRTSAEKKLKNATDTEYDECEAVFYPEWILLHLKKIFREFASPDEKIDFITQIGVLENNLGVDQETSQGLGGNLSGIADMVANLMQNTGNTSSNSAGGIDISQIGNALGSVMNNKGVQESLSEMMNGLTNSNNLEDVVKTLTDKIKDPRLTVPLQEEMRKVNGGSSDLSNGEESSSTGKDNIATSQTKTTSSNETIKNNSETDQSGETYEEIVVTSGGAVPIIVDSN